MTKTIELRTERLLLRPFRLSDIDDVLEYASDPEWATYYPRPYDRGRAEYVVAQAVLTSWDKGAAFAVEHDGRVIGLISLTVDPEDRKAELGYDIARTCGDGTGPGGCVGRLRLGVPRVRTRGHLRARGRTEQALPARDGKAGHGARRDISKR